MRGNARAPGRGGVAPTNPRVSRARGYARVTAREITLTSVDTAALVRRSRVREAFSDFNSRDRLMLSSMCSRFLLLSLLAPVFCTAAFAQPSVTAVRVQQPP